MLIAALFSLLAAADLAVDPFAFDGAKNIMEEEHFGICNGRITVGVNYKHLGCISGLWAPPYASSDCAIEVNVSGAKVPTATYKWRPFQVVESGKAGDVEIECAIELMYGNPCGLVNVTCRNTGTKQIVPIDVTFTGTLDRIGEWEFQRAVSKTPAPAVQQGNAIIRGENLVLLSSQKDVAWNDAKSRAHFEVPMEQNETKEFAFLFGIGAREKVKECQSIIENAAASRKDNEAEYAMRVTALFAALPRLESDNPALVNLYNRSLAHLIMNRWDVPEFILHPYYSTGSVKGGCVCNYLWDFGENWEIFPLYEPAGTREIIKQFLKIDLGAHFAFDPMTGKAQGPCYPINQEKIIGLTYYYLLNTGDLKFLEDTIEGKTILDWMMYHATFRDDLAKPVALVDYGPSNSHLELRRGFPYNHVMPDLNGRRYNNYIMAAEVADWAGKPMPVLRQRAEALKALMKQELWDPQAKWFKFIGEKGADLRYTVQIFKLFNSPVLDADEEAGLLAHLNETEFLSAQGLHSMSKTDVAYDHVDIDNGGGGACTCFPPQIAERLYKCGHAANADDIIARILWWGERLPYWGDSLVANAIDYRKDTPLQCEFDGATVAQCVIFGMMGVRAKIDGTIEVNPHLPPFANNIVLRNLKLRGKEMTITIDKNGYTVE